MRTLSKLVFRIAILILMSAISSHAQTKSVNNAFKSDSIELKTLITKFLKWGFISGNSIEFDVKANTPTDTIYSGIDWQALKLRITQLEKTGFFSKEFFDEFQKIALYLDKELKSNKVKYYVGELPPYERGNAWCDCQDYPANPWKKLRIFKVHVNGNLATFRWTWAKGSSCSISAVRTENNWKISRIEKFTLRDFMW